MGELRGKGEVRTSHVNKCAIPRYLLPIVMYIAFDVISDNLVGQCQHMDLESAIAILITELRANSICFPSQRYRCISDAVC